MKIVKIEDGMSDQTAKKLWDHIVGFAGYGFNKSHSVEYALISYQCMWLKTKYPVEFFAAALTLMDEDKLPALIKEAGDAGITVDTPDINHSTTRFEIVTDTRLAIPFQRIKGISEKTAEAIMEARATGKFTSKDDFIKRVERRRCNVRHQDALDRIGAFAHIEPGQAAPNDPTRIRDQIELIPGLITSKVQVNRDMHRDSATREAIVNLISEYRCAQNSDGMPVRPAFGRTARFMIIADAPNNDEDNSGMMGLSRGSAAVETALTLNGLTVKDAYWTALVKRAKKGKMLTPEEINTYKDYLLREIEILKPPVIVLLGSTVTRHFLPDFSGKASDAAGKIVYSPQFDANLVIAFSPGEIWHDAEKQNNMNAVFAAVADLIN